MICLLVLVASALVAVAQKPLCLVSAPRTIHLNVDETVSVTLQGATASTAVELYFQKQNTDTLVSEKKNAVLTQDNNYQAIVKLRVNPQLYGIVDEDSYVQLVAISDNVFGPKKRIVNIYLSTKRGYLFIQTSKPIYSPGEELKYRIFTLDNYLLPVHELISVQIINSKGLITSTQLIQSNQILDKTITIPAVEPEGYWKITALFHKYPKSETSVDIEVKKFVLPTFEVKINTLQPYVTVKAKTFSFSISARYMYGKGVVGVAYIRFGLIHTAGKTFLPELAKQITINDGSASIDLLVADLQQAAANHGVNPIKGCSLYIAVSVFEKASGNLEEAETSSIKIVTSPYVFDLSRTKRFFSPGGVFSALATARYPDGKRVPNLTFKATVRVNMDGSPSQTLTFDALGNDNGDAVISLQVPLQSKDLYITVYSEVEDGDDVKSMTAHAMQAANGHYLSLEVDHQILQPGQKLKVKFWDITPPNTRPPSYFYYMVWSKGRNVLVGRAQRSQTPTTLDLDFTDKMVPSFHLVGYYFTSESNSVVADSVWVDVKDVCKGNVEIAPFSEQKPAANVQLVGKAEPNSRVALVAVDSAVYILNKNRLTLQTMVEYMNSYDLSCSVGGGEDSSSVLQEAGLAFIGSYDLSSPIPKDHKCHSSSRNKRQVNYVQKFNDVVNSFKNENRKCCLDGVKQNLVHLSCADRLKHIRGVSESCRDAFKKCCDAANERRKQDQHERRKTSFGRTVDGNSVETIIHEDAIYLRHFFPQSWMWKIVDSNSRGDFSDNVVVPDSITTWEIQAVGISSSKGFCIAEPRSLTVFQDFFLSVTLPYSVKRNEQLQVKAVIYNYKSGNLMVTVKMNGNEGVCAMAKDAMTQVVSVPGNSAISVYFTIVPLDIGTIPITVVAFSTTTNDKVEKKLLVEEEGDMVSIEKEFSIEPKSGKVNFDFPVPVNEIPGQIDSGFYLNFKGGVMGRSVENCLNLDGVDRLIQMPTGCAEQTMVTMSPAIHSIKYLDATNQWISLPPERREDAKSMIQSGYTTVLTYQKSDGSYGAFQSTPSSVWLTAFIAKELALASKIIPVSQSYIMKSMDYLIHKQKTNGAWDDPNPLYDRKMKGQVDQASDDVPLTAFVYIAMNQVLKVYQSNQGLRNAAGKAERYLEQKVSSLNTAYSAAITAYALALQNTHQEAQRKLHNMAKCDATRCFWDPSGEGRNPDSRANAASIETTAYGLLNALATDDRGRARKIATWLTEQRGYMGGFQSTQDTVVALEALSKFSIRYNDLERLNLKVTLCTDGGETTEVTLTPNYMSSPIIKDKGRDKISLNVEGTGRGTLAILKTYRTLMKDKTHCDLFHLSVTVEEEKHSGGDGAAGRSDDDYSYSYDEPESDPVVSDIDWFELRSRSKREPAEDPKEDFHVYSVCVGANPPGTVGMVVVDVTLLSGMMPDIQSLDHVTLGTEKYADHYEVHHNKVYLHFAKMGNETHCVSFKAHQVVPMGLVQPASAVVYDYYNPERRCAISYSAGNNSPMISRLCEGDVCKCAEGECPTLKDTFSSTIKKDTRRHFACSSHIIEYAYEVKVLNYTTNGVFKYYPVSITAVLESGKDIGIKSKDTRELVVRASCGGFKMENEASYLIMGVNSDIVSGGLRFRYLLNSEMWIEKIPALGICEATIKKASCNWLSEFSKQHSDKGCGP